MCINAEVSITVFIISMISCGYLFNRNLVNDRWIAILVGYISTMQYLEYLMWKDQECTGLNQMATEIGFWLVISQPIIAYLIAYYFTRSSARWSDWTTYIPLGIYLVFSLPHIYAAKKPNQCTRPCNNSKVGLYWHYTNSSNIHFIHFLDWLFFLIAITATFLMMPKNGNIYAYINVGTYLIAAMISRYRCIGPNNISNGSWWCIMSAVISLAAIAINRI